MPVGYVRFSDEELRRTGGKVIHTPHNFQWDWPPEVRDAHCDLVDHRRSSVEELLLGELIEHFPNDRLVKIPRIEMLAAQIDLARRQDAPTSFRERVGERCRKLSRNERPVFEELNRTLERGIGDDGQI